MPFIKNSQTYSNLHVKLRCISFTRTAAACNDDKKHFFGDEELKKFSIILRLLNRRKSFKFLLLTDPISIKVFK